MKENIPEELLERIPLFQSQWMSMLNKMREHEHSPKWNTQCGDRLTQDDIPFIRKFEQHLCSKRTGHSENANQDILSWVEVMAARSQWFSENVKGILLHKEFHRIAYMNRSNLQTDLECIVPADVHLDRLIINPTSGTTGQPVLCPNHPRAIGCYDPMIQFTLKKHGLVQEYDHTRVAAIQFCAQQDTITYNTVHSYLNGAGFAKINLYPDNWKDASSPQSYVRDMSPVLFSGDPYAFWYAINCEINYQPGAILSTATTLNPVFRRKLETFYQCPIVNVYSLNETGPLAYSCSEHPDRMHILPTDVYIEIIDDRQKPAAPNTFGEIVVTGGRNPFMPLLRYRTGDSARLHFEPCSCDDTMPFLTDLKARKQITFSTPDGVLVNPIDIARILNGTSVLVHQFIQKRDFSCVLRLLTAIPFSKSEEKSILRDLDSLFQGEVSIRITYDLSTEQGKVIPYINHQQQSERSGV